MGVNSNMDGDNKSKENIYKLQLEAQSFENPMADHHCSRDAPHTPHGPCPGGFPHLLASTSSPSLLTGCGDSTTPTGACIEKHFHAHHVPVSDAPALCLPASELSCPTTPLSIALSDGDPPDSYFLTPQPPNARRSQGRPVSAPPHHLERISGALLRLVGDHYLCSTCGRQLRNIGDELALETSLHHILSSSEINSHTNR